MRLNPYHKGNICSILVGLLKRYSNHADQIQRIRRLLALPSRIGVEPEQRSVRVRRHLDGDDELQLVARYEDGETLNALAHSFGINRDTVSGILERHGVERRYHQTTDVDLGKALELSLGGLNLTDVAAHLGLVVRH